MDLPITRDSKSDEPIRVRSSTGERQAPQYKHFGFDSGSDWLRKLRKDLTMREQWQTEEVEKLLSAFYRQSSLLRSYCFDVTSFLASLHGIFWCRLQTVYVWRKSSAWSSSELKLIDAFVLPKTALHVSKLGLLDRIKIGLLGHCITKKFFKTRLRITANVITGEETRMSSKSST